MSALYLAGFNPKAQEALRLFLKSRENRPPGWRITGDLDSATVILVNAANAGFVQECAHMAAPWQELALVGESDFGSGWALILPPVTPTSILNGINQVMAMKVQMSPSDAEDGDGRMENTTSMPLTRPTRHAPLAPLAPHSSLSPLSPLSPLSQTPPVAPDFTEDLQAAAKRKNGPGDATGR